MSELKSFIVLYDGKFIRAYEESEADKVIALLKDKANYNECAYKCKSEELADTCRFYEEELRHHKHKRCLAMARYCMARYNEQAAYYPIETTRKMKFLDKWHKRWLAIAKKFKPKSTAR